MSYRVFSLLIAVVVAFSSLSTLHAAQQQLPDSSAASEVIYIALIHAQAVARGWLQYRRTIVRRALMLRAHHLAEQLNDIKKREIAAATILHVSQVLMSLRLIHFNVVMQLLLMSTQ